MTRLLFREDPYRRTAPATVTDHLPDGRICVDASLFYPTGGGQPGDSGKLTWDDGSCAVQVAERGPDGGVALRLEGGDVPAVGADIVQELDWERRFTHMRIHTALHLLSVVIPLPVTGGSISPEKGRLDFNMPEAPEDRDALSDALNDLVRRDLSVTEQWITDDELDANPGLVKTMSVQPPRGAGQIRLVRIGTPDDQIDLQPCGGTHVARTGEIGSIRFGKIEKKGRQNRRVNIFLEE